MERPQRFQEPVIIIAKIIMQKLSQLKIDWNEAVPLNIQTTWSQYEVELPQLNELQIARKVIYYQDIESLELHSFCDASERAYGACVYVCSVHTVKNNQTRLLYGKSIIV